MRDVIEKLSYRLLLTFGIFLILFSFVLGYIDLTRTDRGFETAILFFKEMLLSLGSNLCVVVIVFYTLFEIPKENENRRDSISPENHLSENQKLQNVSVIDPELERILRIFAQRLYDQGQLDDVVSLDEQLTRLLFLRGDYNSIKNLADLATPSAEKLQMKESLARLNIDSNGWILFKTGDAKNAEKNILAGIKQAKTDGLPYWVAKGYKHLAGIRFVQTENYQEANEFLRQASSYSAGIKDSLKKTEMNAGIAYAHARFALTKSKLEEANKLATQALELYSKLDDKERSLKTKNLMGYISLALGEFNKAKQRFKTALEEANSLKYYDQIGIAELGLGKVYLHENRQEDAYSCANRAQQIFLEIGDTRRLTDASRLIEEIKSKQII